MPDLYGDFSALARDRRENEDFEILARAVAGSAVAVIAPHGGGIEPHTGGMAREIAGGDFSLYVFDGTIKGGGNAQLHITSTRFDEPRALALAGAAETAVTVHGCAGSAPGVFLSGLDRALTKKLCAAFNAAGIAASAGAEHPYQSGRNPANICNRGRSGRGVQIEFTRGLRDDDALRQKAVRVVREVLSAL